MTATCLCGAVCVTIDAPPAFINDCNCSLCRKSGGAWGYFAPEAVTATGQTITIARTDKPSAAVDVHSCAACGATTHWVRTQAFVDQHGANDMVGVNMRLFDPDELTGVEVHFPDGKAWNGESTYGFRRPSIRIGDGTRW